MTTSMAKCSFCGRPRNEVKSLVGNADGPFICERCIGSAHKALQADAVKTQAKKEEPLKKPMEIKEFLDQFVIAQDRAKTDMAVAVYNHYKRREAFKTGFVFAGGPVEIDKSNILLLGPTGTGKTHIARAIARMLNVPFHVADATRLTAAGYVGDDVESLLQGLLRAADGDVDRAQWGIIFVDEIDKIARKSGRNQSGFKDVGGEAVQQALLKIIEGGKVAIPREMGQRMVGAGTATEVIDTTNILFIAAGSFAGIEEEVTQRLNKGASLGFGATSRAKHTPTEVYAAITTDDILEFGMIPEFVGRIPVLTSTYERSEEDMVRVLTEPKNSIHRQMQALWAMDGIDLQFDPEALRAIARLAKKNPTGARALRGIVEGCLAKYAFTAPSHPNLKALRVTEDTVAGGPAILVEKGARVNG